MSSQTENSEKSESPVKGEEPVPHHMSDVDTWGGPDRSYMTFVIMSVLFGFFGLDHFYLRSFATGTQKLLINIVSLGFWYWWDVIQIASDGAKIRTEGLNSPLDWMRGIGRGVFSPPAKEPAKGSGGGNKKEEEKDYGFGAKKSYLIYSFLAIFFGFLGADRFYMGELWQGLAKLISCFNIFLFLFGWLWVLWDSFQAFFLTESILEKGISVPLPYNMLFSENIPGSLFKVHKLTAEDFKTGSGMAMPGMPGMPGVPGFGLFGIGSFSFTEFCSKWFNIPIPTLPVREIYREVVAPLLTVPVVQALQSVGKPQPPTQPSCLEEAINMIPTAEQVHQTVMNAADSSRAVVSTVVEPAAIVSKGMENAVQKTQDRPPVQLGGYRRAAEAAAEAAEATGGPGPVIAGALTAVVLAGGLKGFYDLISKQYG
jgi:TM2 domain-containing membrane protein YozV